MNSINFRKSVVAVVVMLLSVPSIANAAEVVGELANVSGDVLIERNGEFLRGMSESALITGDRVITKVGASTLIKIDDGCDNELYESQSVIVDDEFCEAFATIVQASDTPFAAPISSLNAAPPAALLAAVGNAFGVGQAGLVAASAGVTGLAAADDGSSPQVPVSP